MNIPYGFRLRLCIAAALLATASGAAVGQTLDLSRAYRLAAESDPAYRAAQAARDAGLEAVALARSGLSPTVSFTGTAMLETDAANEPFSNSDTFTRYTLSLDLNKPIYRRDRVIRIGQAKTREERAEVDFAANEQDLIVRVAEAYFNVLNAVDDYGFAQTNRGAIAQQLRQTQQRFEVGIIAITDVEEAKSRFDLASAREIQAKNTLDNARESLREVIGEYPGELATLGGDIPLAINPADIDEWTRSALENNLRVRSSSLAVAIAREEVRLAGTGNEPTVDGLGQAMATDRNRKPGGSESFSASVGIRVHWPIFTGGRTPALTREARARHREAMHRQEQARRNATRLTRQAYLGVESAIARVEALGQAVVSSRSALDAVDAGFQVGTRTSVDVLDAQRDLFQARNDLVAARYDYILNALRLRQAAGTVAPADLEAINEWLE